MFFSLKYLVVVVLTSRSGVKIKLGGQKFSYSGYIWQPQQHPRILLHNHKPFNFFEIKYRALEYM